ncbi:MAG: hypothetical protein DMG25_09995 [Acidobacteria bacterium]|nr:MAG: hypothetical protein DMG25_09995 [Acidobacteriota bacterium]
MNNNPPKERIASSFKQLSVVSTDLNLAADEFSKTISTLDEALKSLKLGVSAWHKVAGHEDEQYGDFWTRDIGYAQVKGKWGIAIRKTWGNNFHDHYEEEVWPFADAPRWMCIESIGRLPDLFDDLIKRTEETTTKIKAKTSEARDLAAAISQAASELAPKTQAIKAKSGRK